MADNVRFGLVTPHLLSGMNTELVWEGKCDEYGNRKTVDIASYAMHLIRIETIYELITRAWAQCSLLDPVTAHRENENGIRKAIIFH